MDIRSARRLGIATLSASPTPALDTDVLLGHVTCREKSFLLAHSSDDLTAQQLQAFTAALERRKTGLPVAYITGHKEFYGFDFLVTPDVLIPKPDTELMTEHAVEWLKQRADAPSGTVRVADVCTGSGCVGLSVVREAGVSAVLTMTDISAAALSVAAKNAERILLPGQLRNTVIVQGDLLSAVSETSEFDMILSNPPYIPADEVTELLKDGRCEPRLALDGDTDSAAGSRSGNDGLAIIKRLIPQAFSHLAAGGIFMLETGEDNAGASAELMKKAGFTRVVTHRDLAGRLRLTTGNKR